MIRIDDNYQIDLDPLNYILVERKVVKKGKNEGQEFWRHAGYYNSLASALEGYLELRVRDDLIDKDLTLTEAIEQINATLDRATNLIQSIAGGFNLEMIEILTERIKASEKAKRGKQE